MNHNLRLFVAIDLPDSARRYLTVVQRDLRAYNLKVRWVVPENIHLTLLFLGDTREHLVGPIGMAMTSAVAALAPFHLAVKGLGVFPSYKRPRVVWSGVGGAVSAAVAVKKAIECDLRQVDGLTYRPERRTFKPHLTLGRAKGPIAPSVLAEVGRLRDAAEPTVIAVDAVHLIQSRLTPQGAQYTKLRSVYLDQC